jgi:hypothetical protein
MISDSKHYIYHKFGGKQRPAEPRGSFYFALGQHLPKTKLGGKQRRVETRLYPRISKQVLVPELGEEQKEGKIMW